MAIAIIMAIIAIKVIIPGIMKTRLSYEQDLPSKLGQVFVIQTYFTAIARHQGETRSASDFWTQFSIKTHTTRRKSFSSSVPENP